MANHGTRLLILLLAIATFVAPRTFAQDDIDEDKPQYDEDVDRAQARHEIPDLFDPINLETKDAHLFGTWSKPSRWPLVAIHAALLPNGEVLTYGTNEYADGGQGFIYDRWNPSLGLTPGSHRVLDVQTSNNIFCSAQALVAGTGGLMLVTGGSVEKNNKRNFGVKTVNVYDPVDDSFYTPLGDMFRARWYPTVTQLADGRLLVHGGRDEKKKPTVVPELFDPAKGEWKLMTGAKSKSVYKTGNGWNYPRSFMAPNGKILVMPTGQTNMYYMTINGRGTMKKIGTLPKKTHPGNHLNVMYRTGKILSVRWRDARILTLDASSNNVEVSNAGNIHTHRYWADATLLANGEVMVSGGASKLQSYEDAVKPVEIWNPDANEWRLGAASRKTRLYHSTSLLLPNGTVLCAGGGPPGPIANLNAEVYYPHYLFNEDRGWRVRPQLLGEVGKGGSVINIRAAGDMGYEEFELWIDGEYARTFTATNEFATYSYTTEKPVVGDQVEIHFVNDQFDANLELDTNLTIDYVEIDGHRMQTEDRNVLGVDGEDPGFHQRETLHNNGFFRFWDDPNRYLQLGYVPHGSELEFHTRNTGNIERAMLIRFGSVTHSFDMGQRGIGVSVEQDGDIVRAHIPSTRKNVPPGFYMLFIINDEGTPSKAAILELE